MSCKRQKESISPNVLLLFDLHETLQTDFLSLLDRLWNLDLLDLVSCR